MDDRWVSVVGVVADIPYGAAGIPPEPVLYFPHDQLGRVPSLFLVVRASSRPLDVLDPIQARIREIDPLLPITEIRTMEEIAHAFFGAPRTRLLLIGIYALLTLALAAGGLYAVMANGVARRRAELGLRRALGATQGQILRMVLGSGVRVAMIGVAAGAAVSLVISRWIESLLFGVGRYDGVSFAIVAVILLSVACGASYVPARRAARFDPAAALKQD